MNKVNDLFKEGIKVIPFIVLGDPDLISNEHLLKALDEKAYDLLMLGMPFSDPVMETSLIQKANTRAIAKGISSDKAFDFLSRLKHLEMTILIDTVRYWISFQTLLCNNRNLFSPV